MLAGLVFVTRGGEEIASFNEAAEWVGMPAFENTTEPVLGIMVYVRNEKDGDKVLSLLKIKKPSKRFGNDRRQRKILTTWWPEKKAADVQSVKFVAEAK